MKKKQIIMKTIMSEELNNNEDNNFCQQAHVSFFGGAKSIDSDLLLLF